MASSSDPIDVANLPREIAHFFPRLFSYGHLPEHLAAVSEPFYHLAAEMIRIQGLSEPAQPKNEMEKELRQRTIDEAAEGLRKLMESKDCMVRAALAS